MANIDANLLKDAFSQFSKASDSIINYYNLLENRIALLKKEVEEKNGELQKAKEYLQNILDSLPVGVVVYDEDSVAFSNGKANRLGYGKYLQSIKESSVKEGEIKNGSGQYRWKKEFLTNGFGRREVVVFEDVTEFERMKERIERDERLYAMGEMAARIAHEIKNPLGSMELFLSMLSSGRLKAKEKKYVDYIRYGVKTVDRIINNILSYTRPKTLVLKKGDINETIREIMDFMTVSLVSRDIEVKLNLRPIGEVSFDPDMIKLVLMNFVSNAIEAIGENGVIEVETKDHERYMLITIADNGIGMSDETRKNIFNPFFTTKDKGVGLGLFIVYNIVKAHGGYIEVESKEKMGSKFFVYIPKERYEEGNTRS
ncbi:MAG: ATP-binding protein [Syntrophorhabdaceae bacterium]|nr:ATP-binding protein [Syntrophorhabdaceae bacterium]